MILKKSVKKISKTEIVAIISGIGILSWILTHFYGGMILWFVSYPIVGIIIFLLYIFSLIDSLISIINKKKSKIKLTVHSFIITTILIINLFESELFKSDRIMSAVLYDDLFHYRLIFRENGSVENEAGGAFGYSETYYGKYKIVDDLIIFSKKPYDNDFIPDTLLLDKNQSALFIEKDSEGKFRTEKKWLNHFEIE